MNWTWNAAPAHAKVEVIDGDDRVLARAHLERLGDYSLMTLIELNGSAMGRSEVWPDQGMYGLPVLLAGGEASILRAWKHAEDRSWWQWSIDFSNHTGRPDDWAPPS